MITTNHTADTVPSPIRMTPEGGHYFFGYYDKSPWDPTQRYLLVLGAGFAGRQPEADDEATVGLIPVDQPERFEPLATTRAWNWQQGCMAQWLDEQRIIYNDRRDGQFVAVVRDINADREQVLPRPIYTVSPDRRWALSLNFARLHRLRPGYGYAGVEDLSRHDDVPEDDGVFRMDLETGRGELIVPVAEFAGRRPEPPAPGQHWINHLQINPEGSRFGVLYRWNGSGDPAFVTSLFTVARDGSDPYPLLDTGDASHYDWRDAEHLLIYAAAPDGSGRRFLLLRDRWGDWSAVGEHLWDQDGHCSYSPDRRWILNDTYPDAQGNIRLMAYAPEEDRLVELGRYHGPHPEDVAARCDLHPRWRPDGRAVCFDSVHEGYRGVYVLPFKPGD